MDADTHDTPMRPRPPKWRVAAHASPARRPTLRERTHIILEEGDTDSRAGLLVEILLMGLILSNVLVIILETEPTIAAKYQVLFSRFESVTIYIFALEYVARVWSCVEDPRIGAGHPLRARLMFVLRPMMIIDFMSFAPFLLLGAFMGGALALRSLRILRLLRLLKIARYSPAIPALIGVLYTERRALIGELMHLVEGSVQPATFGNLPDSIYWATATLATVGYGDHVPITTLGRLIAGLTMVAGLVLFAMPIGIVATGFVNGLHRREFSITWSMVKRQPLFADFSVEAISEILDLVGANMAPDHSRLTRRGEPADKLFVIVSGHARVEDDDGGWELEAGDVIGPEALDEGGKYHHTVTALTEMRVMVMSMDDLRRLARKYPILEQRIREQA
jgi:voltage-gated potassium channel